MNVHRSPPRPLTCARPSARVRGCASSSAGLAVRFAVIFTHRPRTRSTGCDALAMRNVVQISGSSGSWRSRRTVAWGRLSQDGVVDDRGQCDASRASCDGLGLGVGDDGAVDAGDVADSGVADGMVASALAR